MQNVAVDRPVAHLHYTTQGTADSHETVQPDGCGRPGNHWKLS